MTELQYEPNPGSVAARVLAYLRGKPAGYGASNAELSHALGAPAASMSGCLNQAVNAKLIHRDGMGPRASAAGGTGERDEDGCHRPR